MNLKEGISELGGVLLGKIEESARKGETSRVTAISKMLEELEGVRTAFDSLEHKFEDLKRRFGLQLNGSSLQTTTTELSGHGDLSAKAKGALRRQDFLDRAHQNGVEIRQIKGVKYTSSRNQLIGVASATEIRLGRWFLGLGPDNYNSVVLLCEDSSRHLFTFILTTDFLREFLPKLSRDESGQIKFVVKKRSTRFYLEIPSKGDQYSEDQPLESMIDRFDCL